MSKLLKYTHAAAMGYMSDTLYDLEDIKKELPLDTIKIVFTPVNFEWEAPKSLKKTEEPKETKSE